MIVYNSDDLVYNLSMPTGAEEIYVRLRQGILFLELEPGATISEAELCKKYDATRTPVREACRRLEGKGLLEIHPYRGCFVAPLTPAEFKYLIDATKLIEPEVASLAARRATKDELQEIERLGKIGYVHGKEKTYEGFLNANYDFHTRIAAAGGNPVLEEAIVTTHERLMRYFFLVVRSGDFSRDLLEEHRDLIKAIKDKKPDLARKAALAHQENTYERSLNALLEAIGMNQQFRAGQAPRERRRTKEK